MARPQSSRSGFRHVAVAFALVFGCAAGAAAQTTATFSGTWSLPSKSASGALRTTVVASGNSRQMRMEFTGYVWGATNPVLDMSGTLDASGGITMTKTFDPVFGNVSFSISSSGAISATFRNGNDPSVVTITGTGTFAIADENALANTFNVTLTDALPPGTTASLNGTRDVAVPALPIAFGAVLTLLLLTAGLVVVRRRGAIAR